MEIRNKYFKIGETFKDGNKTMKVVKCKRWCEDCFYEDSDCYHAPSCTISCREDEQEVRFIKVND